MVAGLAVTGSAAQDDLSVSPITFTKTFLTNPVLPGESTILRYTIANAGATDATITFFTDNLSTALTGMAAASVPPTPCGAGSSISGTTFLIFTAGTVTAGSSCSFDVPVNVPMTAPDGLYISGTSDLVVGTPAHNVGPAIDTLEVSSTRLQLDAVFTDDPVSPGDTATLEFTLTNLDATNAVANIAFTDDLNAALIGLSAVGLPASNICGAGSTISGTSNLSFTGGSLTGGASCTFSVTVQVPGGATGGDFPNITSDVMGDIGGIAVSGSPASGALQVRNVQLSQAFASAAFPGGTVDLTFTIDNLNTLPINALNLSNDFGATLTGLVATGLPMSNVCGTGSTLSGTNLLTLTGGNITALGQCSFTVTLSVPGGAAIGTYPNVSSGLTSSGLNVAGASSADLVIDGPPTFAKAFAPATIFATETSTLTFTVDNSANTATLSAIAFTDNLPSGMTVAATPNASTTCTGGTITAVGGAGTLSYSGGGLAGGATCTVQVDVEVSGTGSFANTSGDLTSIAGNSGTASDTLTVEGPPAFAKAFAPAIILLNGVSTLTFTIDHSASSLALSAIDFTDNLPADMTVAATPNASTTCTGGTLTAVAGSGTFSYSGGGLAAGATCTVQVDVEVSSNGTFVNTSGDLTSNAGNSGTASDTLTTENPPTFAKAFAPATIPVNGVSTVTFTVDNSASTLAVTALDFTDNLPAGMEVAATHNASTTCTGGTVTAVAGTSVISYSGGTVAAGATCTVQVDVTGTTEGTLTNLTGDLTSDAGNSGTATADLDVISGLLLSKTVTSSPVVPGGFVTVEYTIENMTSGTIDSIGFTEDYDAALTGLAATGLPTANVCGAGSNAAGTGVLTVTGGTLTAASSCTFSITVQVPGDAPVGLYNGATSMVTGLFGGQPIDGDAADGDIEVGAIDFQKVFGSSGGVAGSTVTLIFTVTNPDPVNTLSNVTFSDDLDAFISGATAVDVPQTDVCGAGSLLDGFSVVSLTGGTVAPGASCMFSVLVAISESANTGVYSNVTSALSADVNGAAVTSDAAGTAGADLSVTANIIAIPTLGSWGLWLLILCLTGAALRFMHPRQ